MATPATAERDLWRFKGCSEAAGLAATKPEDSLDSAGGAWGDMASGWLSSHWRVLPCCR